MKGVFSIFFPTKAENSYKNLNASCPVWPKPIINALKGDSTRPLFLSIDTQFTGKYLSSFFKMETARYAESTIFILSISLIFSLSYNFFTPQTMQVHYTIRTMVDPDFTKIDDEYNVYATDKLTNEEIEKYMEIIRDEMRLVTSLYKNDYIIILTDDNIPINVSDEVAAYAEQYDVAGATLARKKVIMINYNSIRYALLHELGHAVDKTYGFSQTEELLAFYNRCDQECYYTVNEQEFFAETYKMYLWGMLNNGSLGAEMCEYFDNICNNTN